MLLGSMSSSVTIPFFIAVSILSSLMLLLVSSNLGTMLSMITFLSCDLKSSILGSTSSLFVFVLLLLLSRIGNNTMRMLRCVSRVSSCVAASEGNHLVAVPFWLSPSEARLAPSMIAIFRAARWPAASPETRVSSTCDLARWMPARPPFSLEAYLARMSWALGLWSSSSFGDGVSRLSGAGAVPGSLEACDEPRSTFKSAATCWTRSASTPEDAGGDGSW
mmetsp:Transcript_28759/g.61733  ORF Transcript_28759/g.61733 Transcript_28759/m.61733 type:complete len:220 (+) Transcript_28759:287-946(+)